MNYGELGGFIAAGFALIGSPGPATLSLAAAGAAFNIRIGRQYFFGILTGAILVIVGVATGLLTAVLAVPHAATVLATVSFAYLAYLAYKIATAPAPESTSAMSDAPGFMTGCILNLANPKAYAAFAALFSGFNLMPQAPVYTTVVKVLICIAILGIANIAWWFAGNSLQRWLHHPRIRQAVNIVFAVLLIASVAAALVMSVG